MQETTNYKLKKPEYNEYADIMDINNNMDVVDQILKGLDERLKKVLTKEQTDSFYAKIAHRHNISDIENLTPTIRTTKVNNSIQADNSDKLKNMNFNWAGQAGQPPWLWGGADGTNMYVYNPANFSVANSNSVQGFQFRNNNGILEVLINGVWMAVGGQIYNNLKQFNFSTYTTTTNNGTTYYNPTVREGEVKTLVDIQRPCKLVAMNSTSSLVYTAGNQIGTECRGIRELRIYIEDILKFTAVVVQNNSSGIAQGEYVINGNNYVGAYTGSAYYAGSYLKNLEARKRFKIDALIGTGINRDGSTYNNGRTPTISTFFAQFLVND